MKKIIRKLVPQRLVNYGKHLPTAVMANIKYKFPTRGMTVIGVTGTDGKTTTVNMIYQVLKAAGLKVSMISTINAVIGNKELETGFHVTNPSPMQLQRLIAQAKKAGSKYLVLEVTSHGLDQFRVWGIKFDIGVITNITHEHLDYHKTMTNYINAKVKLIKNVKYAVLNEQVLSLLKHRKKGESKKLSKITSAKIITFGIKKNNVVNIHNTPLKLKIPGEYNILNGLAAAAVCSQLGVSKQTIISTLSKFGSLPGRMEEVKNNKGIKIVIDFAHTPNALEESLTSLKKQTKGKLIAVFGAASERDNKKRPFMGAVSAKFADITILTDEDPRFEDRNKIIDEIEYGAVSHGAKISKSLFREPDRFEAIKLALKLAQKGDTIGIFGKGHEKSMNYKGVEKAWSEKQAVVKALREVR